MTQAQGYDTGVLRKSAWMSAWCAVLEKTNRIMSGRKVTVSVSSNTVSAPAPAWTDGLNIWISHQEVEGLLRGDAVRAALRLKGLNYHELCHVLYSPRVNSEFRKRVERLVQTHPRALTAMHILEDQRIETWFAASYAASRRYFEAMVMEWILQHGNAQSAVLLYGRKYLSSSIRVRVGKAFVAKHGQPLYDELKTVIDAYLTVSVPAETGKALDLIRQFCELLDRVEANGNLPPLIVDDGDTSVHSGADPAGATVKVARNAAIEAVEDALDADAELEADMDADAAESGDGAGNGADAGDSDADGDADGDPNTGEHDANGSADDHGKGAASSGGAPPPNADELLNDLMDALLDSAQAEMVDIEGDDTVKADAEKMLDAVRAIVINDGHRIGNEDSASADAHPPQRTLAAVRRTYGILSEIRRTAEPETLFRQVHGRVDARRLIGRKPGEADLFRTYNSGREDETAAEAVILIDRSGSMSTGTMHAASEAVWVLKRCFDRLDIRTTVLLYSSQGQTQVGYRPQDKAGAKVRYFKSYGGTEPSEALHQAMQVFYRSHAPNKILITVTDGDWSGSDEQYAPVMKTMARMGVTSLLLGLNGAYANYGKHHHEEGIDLEQISQMPKAATKLVAGVLKRAVSE